MLVAFFPQGIFIRWALAMNCYVSNYAWRRHLFIIGTGFLLAALVAYFPAQWILLNVFLAPWIEEIIYRGLIIDRLGTNKWTPFAPILVSTCLFSLAHYLNGNFSIVQVAAGLFLGGIYWQWRSLPMCIFFHGLGNLLLFLIINPKIFL